MPYSELIKDYERIRDYMRQFYVYGFKSREEYNAKSARSYDNERRRIESWLGEYLFFRQDAAGKRAFLSVDSRKIPHNPLYQSYKAKSFTDKDITLHFYLLDILSDGTPRSVREIVRNISEVYLSYFDEAFELDESTVRKKLKEYETLGILKSEKQGKSLLFRLSEDSIDLEAWLDAVSFFSEESPLGVIGSYLLDRRENHPDCFSFKHHYILHVLDSEILCQLLVSIRSHQALQLTLKNLSGKNLRTVCPMKIYVSSQTGRQYLLGYHYGRKAFSFFRVDAIGDVQVLNEEKNYNAYLEQYEIFKTDLWGVSPGMGCEREHLEMTLRIEDGAEHIIRRLQREKRYGSVQQLDAHTWLFAADVYDAGEMLPWIRSFIGRIVKLESSDQSVADRFYTDLADMQKIYGGDNNAVQ